MAKLKAPLLSMGASGQLGKTLVFFPWKGLNVAREYVTPANPKTALQVTQRGFVTAAVTMLHAAQALAVDPLEADDILAYTLLANQNATPRTWYNEFVKRYINQHVASLQGAIFRANDCTPGVGELAISLKFTEEGANAITAGGFWYGTSPSALIYNEGAVVVADEATATLTGLTAGVKYYYQFRPTAHADFVGVRSGIYYGRPT